MKSISLVKKSENSTEFVIQHSNDGQMKEKSAVSEHLETKDSTDVMILEESLKLKVLKRKRESYVMPESVVKNKKEISKDKWKTSEENTQTMKSFKTSEVASISKGKDLKPWWTKSCLEISRNLSSVIETNLSDLDMRSLNKYAKSLSAKSWFNIKMSTPSQPTILPKTYYPLLQCSLPNIMDSEQEKRKGKEKKQKSLNATKKVKLEKEIVKKEAAEKCKKIRLYPNENERNKLNQWMGCARWTYNQCLNGVNKENITKSKKELRNYCLKSTSEIIKKNEWTSNTPYDIRDEAMCDLLKAFKTCFSVGEKFKMKYKRKKDNTDSIVIHLKHFNAARKKEMKEIL
jgi:putative transposase